MILISIFFFFFFKCTTGPDKHVLQLLPLRGFGILTDAVIVSAGGLTKSLEVISETNLSV